jgi:transposase
VLSAWLRKHCVKRVGIEASGGCEQMAVARLRGDGFVVIVFQPAQVRGYAKFHLQRAKNDKMNAALIAVCTAATRKISLPPDPRLARPGRCPPYRRRSRTAAQEPLYRSPASRIPLEPAAQAHLPALDSFRKAPQSRADRLRQEVADLRQYRR